MVSRSVGSEISAKIANFGEIGGKGGGTKLLD
jgi:hypothetical protein